MFRIALPVAAMAICFQTMNAQQPISKIVFGSCIKQDYPIPILYTMRMERPELLVFLGDNIYADTEDMKVMRAKYEKLATDREFQALTSSCPTLATWDDHDYGVDDAGADYPQKEASQTEFLDFWGVGADSPRRRRAGVYHSVTFGPPGKRLQVIMLDTRYFRSPLKRGLRQVGGPYCPDPDPDKTMLGDAQWEWLEEQLSTPAEIRLIGSSIQFAASAAGQETWANLPLERKKLIELISNTGARGVVIISGDRHWAELSRISEDVPYPLYDLTSSSLNQIHRRGTPTDNDFRHIESTYHRENYGVITIDWGLPDPLISLQVKDIEAGVRIDARVALSELE